MTEWGYGPTRNVLAARADLLVWLDLPRTLVLRQVVRRTVVRRLRRQPLWNGNTESLLAWRDPEHPVRWTWTQHGRKRAQVAARLADPRWGHLQVVHLRSAREARRWLRTVPTRSPPH